MHFLRRHAALVGGAFAALAVLGGGFVWLRDSSLVAVRHVTVTGVDGPQAEDIRQALTEAAREMTTLHVRDGALRTAAQPFPVVRDVTAHADLPHTLRVTVHAYAPIGAVTVSGRATPVAADGTVLDGTPTRGLPVIAAEGSAAGTRLTNGPALRLVRLLASAPAPLRARAARALVGAHGLAIALRQGPRIDFGDLSELRAKWAAAAAVLADADSSGASYVDVRLPDRPAAGGLPPTVPEDSTSTTG